MTTRRAPKTRRKPQAWGVDDARWFLESAWHAGEALYAAFVLVLVLGRRRGEMLGLARDQVDLDAGEVYVGEQLQRVGHQLVLREVKTETSEAPLPLPELCIAAPRTRKRRQDKDRKAAGDGWIDNGLVFTTRYGTPIEPRNFNRSFDCCIRALLCASCGTARSTSRWRSTPRPRLRPPEMRSAGSATSSRESRCCRLLLPEDQKEPVP